MRRIISYIPKQSRNLIIFDELLLWSSIDCEIDDMEMALFTTVNKRTY